MAEKSRLPDPARLDSYPLDVARCKAGECWYVKTVSDSYAGLFGHWIDKRTRYCPGPRCDCQYRKKPRQWYAYFAAELWRPLEKLWLPCVWQLTEASEHDVQERFRRGQVWEFSRQEGDDKKHDYPVVGRLVEELDPSKVPPLFAFKPVLLRLFRVAEITEYYPNPRPKQPRVPLSADTTAPAPLAPPPPKEAPTTDQYDRLRAVLGGIGKEPHANGTTRKDGGQ